MSHGLYGWFCLLSVIFTWRFTFVGPDVGLTLSDAVSPMENRMDNWVNQFCPLHGFSL